MATNIIMPKQGLQMTEGTITKWLKSEGDVVKIGDPLFEMETDKLTITIDAEAEGTLLKIVQDEGKTVPITHTIAILGAQGEDLSSFECENNQTDAPKHDSEPLTADMSNSSKKTTASQSDRVFSTPRARMIAEEKNIDLAVVPGTGTDGLIIAKDVMSAKTHRATPLAKKIASIENIDITKLSGSGARGKVTSADLKTVTPEAKHVCKCTDAHRGDTLLPLTGMRKLIAKKMVESLQYHAQATHNIDVDMSNAITMRNTYKTNDKNISYNDIVVLATTKALMDFPVMNSSMSDEGILQKNYVNMGVAVAIDGGLVVPVIKDADLMKIEQIALTSKALAKKAKENKLSAEDCSGGTFTVSNLGMFGLNKFTAIINTPESGILAVGAIEKKPVVIDDEISIRSIMSLTLTYDHRVIDGAPAAAFLKRIKQYIEHPCLML